MNNQSLPSNFNYHRYVDGGMLQWIYGSSPGRHIHWMMYRSNYFKYSGNLIILDSRETLYRKIFDPDYKSRRKSRKEDNAHLKETSELVYAWAQNTLLHPAYAEDFSFVRIDGFEADDLIAAYSWLSPQPIQVCGADKDLLQLGSKIALCKVNDEVVSLSSFAQSKLPQSVIPHIKHPWQLLFTLSVLGDKSDSVNRLLPHRAYDEFIELLNDSRPWSRAHWWLGDDLVKNLYLTILPGPWIFEKLPHPLDLLEAVEMDQFNLQNFSIAEKYLEILLKV